MSDSTGNIKPRQPLARWGFPALVVAVLVLGGITAWWAGRQAEEDWSDQLLKQTTGIARTIDANLLKQLRFDESDRQNPAYQRIRGELTAYGQALGLTQIWSTTRKDGHLVFGPENIPTTSQMASEPGTIYKNPSKKNEEIFLTGEPGLEGPYTDEYGTFISAFAPVKDPRTGKILLVIGADVPVKDWHLRIWQQRTGTLGLTVVMLLILFCSYEAWRWRERSSGYVKKYFRHLEAATVLLTGLLLTWCAVQLAHSREQSNRKDTFSQIAEAQVAAVREGFRDVKDTVLPGLEHLLANDSNLTAEQFSQITSHLASSGGIKAVAWAPLVTGDALADFQSHAKKISGQPDFHVYEKNSTGEKISPSLRANYFPILNTEPLAGNQAILGFNLAADNTCGRALATASATRFSTASDPVNLGQPNGTPNVSLVVRPVFENSGGAEKKLKGFAVAVLRFDPMLDDVLSAASGEGKVAAADLLQLADGKPATTLASWPSDDSTIHPDAETLLQANEKSLWIVRPVFAFGQAYALAVTPGSAFMAAHPNRAGLLVGSCGLFVTLITTLIIGLMRHRQHLLEEEVTTRTELLRATVDRLQMLWHALDQSPVSILITDARQCIEYVNQKQLSLSGYSRQELVGQSPRIFKSNTMPAETYQILRETLSARMTWTGELCNRKKNGTLFWESGIITPIKDKNGNVTNYLAIKEDITERKNSELELKKSFSQLQATLESTADGILVVDTDGKIVNFNPQFVELWRLSAKDLKNWDEARLIEEFLSKVSDPETVLERIKELHADRTQDSFEVITLTDRRVIERYSHAHQADGVPAGRVWSFRDITQQERAHRALQESNEQLEAASSRANEMALKAEMANIAKSHFLANMSHEIRTPMNGVIGMTTLLLQTDLTAEQQQYAHLLKNSGESLLALINDILDFSKIEAQKLTLEKLDFNLRETMEDATELLAFKTAEKNLQLACFIAPEVPELLRGDALRLRQIFINLAGNAIKFTAEGSVVLRAALIAEDEKSATLKFTVKDSGIGIPKDRQSALFHSFTQVDGSTTRKFGGTGLGLAISKHLTEMMGGQIGLESEVGAGTEFWFTVALDKQPPAAPATKTFSGTSVLVVKNRAIYRQVIAQQLSAIGCNYALSENFPDAENQLAQRAATGEPFSVVLIGQDTGDAAAFAENIRNHPRLRNVRLVKLTPFGCRATAAELAQSGFAGQLNQPFRRAQLLECLAHVLQKNVAVPKSVPEKLSPTNTTPMRVLIVDDNSTNLVVICKILEKLGHRPRGVGSAAEGIAALQSPDFDLVLMDCQMPEMDGYEATQNIRSGAAGEHSRTLPIVALTANVLAADQQRCLAAGMDGYLGKPIQMDALKAALEKWQPTNGTPAASTTSSEPVAVEKNPTAETPAVENISTPIEKKFSPNFVSLTGKAIFNRADLMNRMLDDMEMATLTAQAFLDDLPKQTAALLKAVTSGDPAATASAAHRLKGAAGTMGGDSLHYLLGEIERLGKAKDMDAVTKLARQIEGEAAALAEILTSEILNAPPDPFGVPFAEKA